MNNKFDSKNSILRIFIEYYRPHLKLFIGDIICAFLIAIIELAFPFATNYALNNFLGAQQYSAFYWFIGISVVVLIFRAGMTFYVNYFGHTLGVRMEADMRQDAFSQLQKLSFGFFDQNRTGKLMTSVTTDLFDVTELAHHGPEDLFISVVTLVGALILMFMIQWKLALILVVAIVVWIVFAILSRKSMSKASGEVKANLANINADLESSISGVRVARAFANEPYEEEKFHKSNRVFVKSKRGFYLVMSIFQGGVDFLANFLYVLIIGVGGILILRGEMNIAGLIAFTLYVNTFFGPIKRLTTLMEQFQSGMAGFTRFVKLLRTNPDIVDKKDAIKLEDVQGEIIFDNVTFAYGEEDKNVLSHVNLYLHPGKMTALVGPSGGGKTTLCQLIPRFYDVDSGSVCIDGIDVRDLQMASLRSKIGIVQQDMYLFASTIEENIRYGKLDATREEIIEAAKNADIHEFIEKLPNGYDTMVGERGTRLSGGQKQRICIARIFLKNPPIVILDEATSALDTQTELRVQKALERLIQNRTTLVIAHRLSTIKNADEIVVIDEHGIREQGTHEDLLAKDGGYKALVEAQFQTM